MKTLVSIVAGLGLEVGALLMLDPGVTQDELLVLFWGFHALAASLIAYGALMLTPSHWRHPPVLVWGFFFSFGFFIPVLGMVGLLVVLHVALRYPKSLGVRNYREIREPQYLMTLRESRERSDIRAAQARHILNDPKRSVDSKLRVMLALQHMRPKVAVPLLQGLLSDPVEDLRLLAYSMLDAWEKDLAQRIGVSQQALADATSRDSKREMINACHQLAELYWEQVDTGLARGDLKTFALEQAKEQCERALSLDPKLAGLWLHYGCVLMELGNVPAAEKAFRLAHKTGMSDIHVMPYLARIAYELNRFQDVRTFLKRINQGVHLSQGLHQVVHFWSPPPARGDRR
jgi:polysaccharide biosynthesis protein PelE